MFADDFITVVQTSQANTSSLAYDDYDECGDSIDDPTEGIDTAERKDLSNITTDQYVTFDLNSTGLSWISKAGWTKLGLREGHDALDNSFSGSADEYNEMEINTEHTSGTSKDPYIEITYTTPGSGSPLDVDTIQDLSYTYDKVGNITQIIDNSGINTAKTAYYTYDDLYRLTIASTTNASTTDYLRNYTYNAIGNITNKSDQGSYTYNGHAGTSFANPHAATQIASNYYTYDKNGNVKKTNTWSYSWDYNNRLIQSTSSEANIQYGYDQNGQRVFYGTGSATTTYANRFYNTDGTNTTKYIYANGILIASIENTDTNYVHTDHLTGSNAITNSDGEVAQLLDYYPYGDQRINEKYTSFDEKRKFTGHEYDDETELNYMVARYQDGNVGRFISVDPVFNQMGNKNAVKAMTNRTQSAVLADPQKLNAYSYARNNPLRFIDPFGLWTDDGDGSFTAEKGDTLSGLQQETGRNWQDTGFNRDPKTLQIGETVSFNKSQVYAGLTVDSTAEAIGYYFIGPGGSVNLGPSAQSALKNSSEQKYHEERIVSGVTPSDEGNYGVDLTDEQFYIGGTVVEYDSTHGTKYGVTTFTGFVRDGFWDIYKKNGDGMGPKWEIPGGTPYSFNPHSWTISYPTPN